VEVYAVNIIDKEKVDCVRLQLPDKDDIESFAVFFQAFSDPTRLMIIYALALKELCVCDLSALAGVSVSAISHQMRYLWNLKVVTRRKQGKMVYYSLKDQHIVELIKIVMEHNES